MISIRLLATTRHLFPVVSCRRFNVQAENFGSRQRLEMNDHPFEQMYPWRSVEDFVSRLQDGILYEDEYIVAIDKPWGVGIHNAHPTIKKQNDYLRDALNFGDPRFSIDDALPHLCLRLRTKQLTVRRSIDRFESGIILLAKDEKGASKIDRMARYCKPNRIPFAKFWCITKGYPVIPGTLISEQITLQKIDADELAEYKEPTIVNKKTFTKAFMKEHEHDFTSGSVEMRVLETNKEFAVALVQIATNQTKFSFVRCYAASKTSFILGDVRFAKRVRHVLGRPVTLAAPAVPVNDNYEPLPFPVRKRLLIPANASVPLMIHLKSVKIPHYLPQKKDLEISTTKLPDYFDWALYRLFMKHKAIE